MLSMIALNHIQGNFIYMRRITLKSSALWAGRLMFIWWLCTSLIDAPDSRAIIGVPKTVTTEKPHLCVHTRLIDEVSEWKIQHSLEAVSDMGATTIVEFFPWAYIEPEQGVYNWQQADRIVRHAENQGIRIIARTGFVPAWARPDVNSDFTTLNYLPEESFDDFARFTAAFARRYAGIIDHIIIWNEPNLAFEWGYRPVSAEDYTKLLQVTYPQIKAANPDAIILAGALAPTLEPRNSPNGLNDILYLTDMYEQGAEVYFDALAIHTYGFSYPPDDEPHPDKLNFRRAELLLEVMADYGDADKPVYITESGWNDHPRWTLAVTPSQRVQYTLESLEITANKWSTVENHCIWVLRYPAPTLSYPDHFTLLTTAFQRKPIFNALRAYARNEERSDSLWLPPPVE